MNTIDKIKEQIHTGEIKFFGSDVILDKYDIENVNHLTCAIIENYLYKKTSDFYEVSLEPPYFRTHDEIYMELDELIETNEEITSFYYTLDNTIGTTEYSISIQIDINIPTYNEDENYEEYIKCLFKNISRKTFQVIENFDPEECFDDLYVPYQSDSPRVLLYNLDKAKDTFYKFLDELK